MKRKMAVQGAFESLSASLAVSRVEGVEIRAPLKVQGKHYGPTDFYSHTCKLHGAIC
jgi:hypothetical protein